MISDYSRNVRDNHIKLTDLIFDVFAGMYFLNKLLPVFGYYLPGVAFLGLFAYLMFFSLARISTGGNESKMLSMFLLLSIAGLQCVKFVFGGSASRIPIYLYGELQAILYGMIVLSYQCRFRQQKQKRLFWLVIVCYFITAVTTVIGNINYPQASRFLATFGSGDYLYGVYTRNNIGGFSFVYELVLITPLIVYMLKKKRMNRFFGSALLITIALVVIYTEYTTALLFYFISLCTLFVYNLNQKKTASLFVIFGSFIFLASEYIANLFLKLSAAIGNPMFAMRFKYIAYTLLGKAMASDDGVGDRVELYKKSLSCFVESNGIGMWNERSVGGHSLVFDAMGSYGVFGIIAVVIIYIVLFKLLLQPYKGKDFYGYMVWAYLVALVFAFINPKAYYFFFIVVMSLFANVMSLDSGGTDNEGIVDSK